MQGVETACLFEYDLRFQRMLFSKECYILSKHTFQEKQNSHNFKFLQGVAKDKELE